MPSLSITATLLAILTLINIGSLRTFYKFTPYPIMGFVGFIFLLALMWVFILRENRIERIPVWGIFCFLALAFLYMYPIADSRKLFMGGSDQDDCIRMLVNNYLSGNFTYTKSYLGNPCSSGPSEFLFYLPVAIWDNYFSIVPCLTLIIVYFVTARIKSHYFAMILIVAQLSCLSFYEISASGSDFIPIGWAYAIGILLALKGGHGWISAGASIVALSFFGASRTPLFILLFFVAAIFLLSNQKKAFFICIFSILISFCAYLAAFLLNEGAYPPFHLFQKAYLIFGETSWNLLIVLMLCIPFLYRFLVHTRHNNISSILRNNTYLILSAGLNIPMLFFALIGLTNSNFNFSVWEAANYVMVGLPSLLLILTEKSESQASRI